MLYMVQMPNGAYRIALTLQEAIALARQVAKASGRSAAIRRGTVQAGDTVYYVQASGQVQREAPRMKAFWE